MSHRAKRNRVLTALFCLSLLARSQASQSSHLERLNAGPFHLRNSIIPGASYELVVELPRPLW